MCVRVCEELLKCVQKSRNSRLDLASGSRLQAAKLKHTCQACQKLKHRTSCSLQDKSIRLVRQFARGLNSQLNLVARLSSQNTLFGKIWRFTFLFTLLYIYPYTHDFERASRENFERETLEKKQDWLIHNLCLRDSSNSSTLFLSIVKSLRGLLPKPYLTISISMKELFGVWETVRKEPMSHWLMLWSSNGIQEARKEIGSVQPRWSKKLGGLRHIG